jgi:hypothetical protein
MAVAIVSPILGAIGFAPSVSSAATTAQGGASNFQFSVEPYSAPGTQQRPNFTYELPPGHAILDRVVVLNGSSGTESFVVYPEDATAVLGATGFGFQQNGQIHNTAVGKWVTIGQTRFSVPPGKEVVVPFQLSVPSNGSPGDHVGGIIVQQVQGAGTPTSKEGVNLVLRFGVPIYLRVVGPVRPSMAVQNLTVFHSSPLIPGVGASPKVAVRLTLVNTGNVILNPRKATVAISALIGGTLHAHTVYRPAGSQSKSNPLPSAILPGGRMVLTEGWTGIPPFDPLTAHVSVSAYHGNSPLPLVTASSATFWYFPWLIIVILVALIIGFLLWRRWRRNRGEGTSGAPTQAPNESSEPSVADPVGPAGEAVEEVGV